MGAHYLDALELHERSVAKNVTSNLFDRHIKPLFLDGAEASARTQERMAGTAASA
jgi:hypothetical protein